jgi:hypothetical protein
MTRNPVLVRRTRREWRATARVLRTQRPELAAKITLARLTDVAAEMDEPLTIAFTGAEFEQLVLALPDRRGLLPADKEIASTVAAVEAFLGLPSKRERDRH